MLKIMVLTVIMFLNCHAVLGKEVPSLTSSVMDIAKVLDEPTKNKLENEIRLLYNEGKGPQITILVVKNLEDTNIEEYAHKVFTTWKLGDAKRDDGVLYLVAIENRKMRIEVGQGLEGSLTDLKTSRIQDNAKPFFKKGDYSKGIETVLAEIKEVASQKEAVQTVSSQKSQTNQTGVHFEIDAIMLLIPFLFGFMIAIRNLIIKISDLSSQNNKIYKQIVQNTEYYNNYKDKSLDDEKRIEELRKNIKEQQEYQDVLKTQLNHTKIEYTKTKWATLESLKDKNWSLSHDVDFLKKDIEFYKKIIKEGK